MPGQDEDCVYIHGATYSNAERRDQWGDHPVPNRCRTCQQLDTYTHKTRERTAYAPMKGEDVTLKVVAPAKLAQRFPDGMQTRPSLFGIPPYGGAVSGRHSSPDNRDLCAPVTDKAAAAGQRGWPTDGTVVLLPSAGAALSHRRRVAQRTGARALIIVNNDDATDGSTQNLPYMQTDQDTSDIAIPSVIIHETDGNDAAADVR